jgi:hypothetical protein
LVDRTLQWISDHDDKWAFTVTYIGLSIILSIAISLFWLLVVVLIHVALEWIALKNRKEPQLLQNLFWHLKLDLGLVLFALCLSIYMDTAFGLVGLGAAARTGAQVGTRFIIWQRALRGILLTLDDAAQVSKIVLSKINSNKEDADSIETSVSPWKDRWSLGDWISLILLIGCLLLIFLSPLILGDSVLEIAYILAKELHPWP